MRKNAILRNTAICAFAIGILGFSGCQSLRPSETTEAWREASILSDNLRSEKVPINFLRLRQDQPEVYILGPGDTLGIYIQQIVPMGTEEPPIHYAEPGSSLPPAVGYPFPIREDGTISLPWVPAIEVSGCSLAQAEQKIRTAYTITQPILPKGQDRIIVSIIRKRTYRITVIREDTRTKTGAGSYTSARGSFDNTTIGSDRRGETSVVQLDAYENDVLNALMRSGGLPGLEAKNEIIVLRGAFRDAGGHNSVISNILAGNDLGVQDLTNPNILRIPLRVDPDEPPPILSENDIILTDGDIVLIQSRDAEVFYTGGLLAGGQHPLPRDFDLDILGAVAMSGGSIAAAAGGSGGNNQSSGVGSIFPPTRILVLREENGRQRAIELDTTQALRDPRNRLLIKPNDFILLEYTQTEMAMNVLLDTLNVTLSLDSMF